MGTGKLFFAAAAGLAIIFLVLGAVIACGAALGSTGGSQACVPDDSPASAAKAPKGVPARLVPIYQGAAERFQLGPDGASMLAGVNYRETNFGTNVATSGPYVGPMAHGTAYWDTYGVDGDGDGKKEIMNEADAIYAAAKVLKQYNAPKNWRSALASYNAGPANKSAGYGYADEVMKFAKSHKITGGSDITSSQNCPPADSDTPANCEKLSGNPKDIVDTVALPIAHEIDFKDVTPKTVESANAAHSNLTTSGNVSDHKGPPDRAWAADISDNWSASNGSPNMTKLASKLAECFGVKWSGSGLVNANKDGYQIQLIYKTTAGGNHYNHVHIGVQKG